MVAIRRCLADEGAVPLRGSTLWASKSLPPTNALGGDLRIEYRWGASNVARIQEFAKELVTLQPDLIVAITTPVTRAATRNPDDSYRFRDHAPNASRFPDKR
jgi:hypothetical protein